MSGPWRATALAVLVSLLAATALPPNRTVAQEPPTATPTPVPDDTQRGSQADPSDQHDEEDDEEGRHDVGPEDERSDEVRVSERSRGRRTRNVAQVINRSDGRLRVRGRIQLGHITGDRVEPTNMAMAYSSCTDCQSFAVALQIVLIPRGASYVAPQNAAVALNYQCTRCKTVANAYQYVYSVDDPNETPDNAKRLIREMERELRDIGRDKDITPDEAEARVNAVIAQFKDFAATFDEKRDATEENTSPNAAPPAAGPSPITDPTATMTPTVVDASSDSTPSASAPSASTTPTEPAADSSAPAPTPTPSPTPTVIR